LVPSPHSGTSVTDTGVGNLSPASFLLGYSIPDSFPGIDSSPHFDSVLIEESVGGRYVNSEDYISTDIQIREFDDRIEK
jgi:hypothetical protein